MTRAATQIKPEMTLCDALACTTLLARPGGTCRCVRMCGALPCPPAPGWAAVLLHCEAHSVTSQPSHTASIDQRKWQWHCRHDTGLVPGGLAGWGTMDMQVMPRVSYTCTAGHALAVIQLQHNCDTERMSVQTDAALCDALACTTWLARPAGTCRCVRM